MSAHQTESCNSGKTCYPISYTCRMEESMLACSAGDCYFFLCDWSSTLDHGGSDSD